MRKLSRAVNSATVTASLDDLLGSHPRIKARKLALYLDDVRERLHRHRSVHLPAFQRFRERRREVIARERERLRLSEYQPRPLTTFVRNRLINEVYLPLLGDNFAKQIGAAGSDKRTDSMGMLLLISPPGYGKTTLMEYVAERLGLIFMKINCPTIGHQVISLDPREAPNATARQELEKLNLALEMGNNVMLYLDDIQHANPEFLQKFISLADGQRRIEGVWQDRARTYDLRGKRFCIAMAGNPYTESGEMFQIPDMLANRADIYNLGDILSGKEEAFALSYLENALTANPVLAPLASREQADVYRFLRLAHGEEVADSEFSHAYSAAEREEILAVLRKLIQVQAVLLKVNQQYIASAAQADAYRVEPPFKLQGSYRNMSKLAEKIVAVMNEDELQALITDHYTGEAQTLTTGAEENLLKLAELRGKLTEAQQVRWQAIKDGYARTLAMGDEDTDPTARVVGQLSQLGQNLQKIQQTLLHATRKPADAPRAAPPEAWLEGISTTLGKIAQTLEQAARAQGHNQEAEITQLSQTLGEIPAALRQLAQAPPKVEVLAQHPAELLASVRQLVEIIEHALLPVVRQFDRKNRLDMVIWERLKDVSDTLRALDKEAFTRAKLANRRAPGDA